MKIIEWLNTIDKNILLELNSVNNEFFDSFFTFFTSKEVWYPLYILLLVVFIKKYKVRALWVTLFLAISIVFSDQISGLIKYLAQRYRPSNEPTLEGLLNLPIGKRGLYGFVSSHAANSVALTVFVGLLSKSKRLWVALGIWTILICYSRVYVGVHYPGDVLVGSILGGLLAWLNYYLLSLFDNHFLRKEIGQKGHWKSKYSTPILLGILFTTSTLLVVAQLINH